VSSGTLPTVALAERASSLALRDFDAGRPAHDVPTPDQPPPAEHPAVLVLGTAGDGRADWLTAAG
jgi:hypothetical protein